MTTNNESKLNAILRPELDSQKTALRLAFEAGLKANAQHTQTTGLVFSALRQHTGIVKRS